MKNNKMKVTRKSKKISQQELATMVEVSRQTINMIEAGNYNPSINLCLSICYALDMTLDQLFWKGQNE